MLRGRGSGFRRSEIDLAVHSSSVTTARKDRDAKGVSDIIVGGIDVVASQLRSAGLVGVTDDDSELPLDGTRILRTGGDALPCVHETERKDIAGVILHLDEETSACAIGDLHSVASRVCGDLAAGLDSGDGGCTSGGDRGFGGNLACGK